MPEKELLGQNILVFTQRCSEKSQFLMKKITCPFLSHLNWFFSNWILRVWICFCHRAIFLCWSTTKKGCYTQSRVLIFYDRRRVARYYRETHGLQRLWFFGNGWLLPKLFEIGRKTIKIQNSERKIGRSDSDQVRNLNFTFPPCTWCAVNIKCGILPT